MTIGIDARMYGGKQTGIGNYIRHLTNHLFQIDQENEYLIFLLEPEFSQYKVPSQKVKKIKVDARWYTFKEQFFLPAKLKKYPLDLMHFPHFNAPFLYSRKYIVTVHDITQKYFPGPKALKSLVRREAYKLVFSHNIKKASRIISVSHYTKQDILENFKVNPQKIEVIYEGIDPYFKPLKMEGLPDSLKNKYKISKSFLLYVGVLRDHKNITGLIKAFNLVIRKNGLDFQLVIVGNEDPPYPKMHQLIRRLKLNDRVVRPGFISKKDLLLLYNAATLLILPSFREGFGFPPLEAMMCGTPVAASNTTALPEILDDAALLFNPHKIKEMTATIVKILKEKKLQQQLIQRGFRRVEKFSWRRCAEKTLKLYQESLHNHT